MRILIDVLCLTRIVIVLLLWEAMDGFSYVTLLVCHSNDGIPGIFCIVFFLCVNMVLPQQVIALAPEEVLVVVNENVRESAALGRYYLRKRSVPQSNLVKVSMGTRETCSRKEYDLCLAIPVREHLLENGLLDTVRCVVLMYGMPLRIEDRDMSENESRQINAFREKLEALEQDRLSNRDKTRRRILEKEIRKVKRLMGDSRVSLDRSASVDSELALVLSVPYPVEGWAANPMYIHQDIEENVKMEGSGGMVLMVSRLDAPDPGIVHRIIDESIQTEKEGLSGRAYFDARWPRPDIDVASRKAYRYYDQSIHTAAYRVLRNISMPVIIDHEDGLFEASKCPEAALYCGWYSLSNYVDAFDWVPGAVGYHIASGECVTLRDPKSRAWCPMMLKDGIAATLGPVDEPYIQAFPLPGHFFGLLSAGRYTLVECYFYSVPYLSWKMVLIGDPLYRPFIRH